MSPREDLISFFKDPNQLDGTWYEVKKDKFTLFETTGKCNRAKVTGQTYEADPETGELDFTKPIDSGEKFLTEDGEEVLPREGFHVVWHLSNSQEDKVIDHSYVYTGGIVACPNDANSKENCYMDWDTSFGMGIVGKSDAILVGSDGENWAVTYACKDKLFNLKNEWVWIHSKEKTLSEKHLAEAEAALKDFLPDFDLERLVAVTQGENECAYADF